METINIHYIFKFPDQREEKIDLHLNPQTLDLINEIPEKLPSWTKLEFHQCPNCSLTIQTHPNCPLAIHLVKPFSIFDNLLSYETIRVDIVTNQRISFKDISAQKGMSSIMGLIMATSGCPHMGFFKPMARFHLPLATSEETVYRAVSMYLLAQYFLHINGDPVDLELKGLKKIYSNIQLINRAMFERLRAISNKDVSINALVILDAHAQTVPLDIDDSLQEIRSLFTPYFLQAEEYKHDEKEET